MGLFKKIRRKLRAAPAAQPPRSRRDKLLARIDVAAQTGLEIGPLFSPLVTKKESNGNVRYVDQSTAEQLRAHYRDDPHARLDDIVEPDFIWGDQTLPDLVGGLQFDYVLASHVIEHVPNPIGWLREIGSVLRDGGILSLAIPDKRYTFDFNRELTSLGALVESYLQDRRRPSTRDVFDHRFLVGNVDTAQAWKGELRPEHVVPIASLESAWEQAQLNERSPQYRDVHVTIVTPTSFLQLLGNINRLGLLDFSLVDFVDTQPDDLEFIVTLHRTPRQPSDAGNVTSQGRSIETMLQRIRQTV
jgi:SAM-dependent methyltransferase